MPCIVTQQFLSNNYSLPTPSSFAATLPRRCRLPNPPRHSAGIYSSGTVAIKREVNHSRFSRVNSAQRARHHSITFAPMSLSHSNRFLVKILTFSLSSSFSRNDACTHCLPDTVLYSVCL